MGLRTQEFSKVTTNGIQIGGIHVVQGIVGRSVVVVVIVVRRRVVVVVVVLL